MSTKGIRIVTLVENQGGVHKGLRTEHGISFYVEFNGKSLLFDTGQSDAFLRNAEQLKIDFRNVEALCVSHGHYDHSGGVRHLFAQGITPPVWIGKGFFDEKYAKDGTAYEYVGNNFDAEYFKSVGITYHEVDTEVQEILPGVFAVTRFERVFPDETVNPRFWVLRKGAFEQDLFGDEISLVLETSKGLVVLLGCSHPGVKNILFTITKRFSQKIYIVLGGTHMVEATEGSVERSIQ